jgi:hypothetical protein
MYKEMKLLDNDKDHLAKLFTKSIKSLSGDDEAVKYKISKATFIHIDLQLNYLLIYKSKMLQRK